MKRFSASYGRFVLVGGLLAGVGSPGLSSALVPWIPELIAALLFLNAMRTGKQILGSLSKGLMRSLSIVLALQLALPLIAVWLFSLFLPGLHPFAFGAVLMMAAPALTGAANFMTMTGRDPVPAMRLLVIGTLVFPLTAFVVLFAVPGIQATTALFATLRLAGIILLVVLAGFLFRAIADRRVYSEQIDAFCDNTAAILLGVVVIGLMASVGPLFRSNPGGLVLWLIAATGLNLGLLTLGAFVFKGLRSDEAMSSAVIAGNRNMALFLLALPEETMRTAMLFIGSYQVPMYLTPFFVRMLRFPKD